MTTPNDFQNAEALFKSLHGKGRQVDSNIPVVESALGKELQSIASEIEPSARFQASLEKGLTQLAVETTQKTRRFYRQPNLESSHQNVKFNLWHILAWGAVIMLLMGGLGWAIRSVLPNSPGNQPMAGGINQTSEVAVTNGLTETHQTDQDEETPLASSDEGKSESTVVIPTATPFPVYSLPSLPNAEVFLAAPFPVAPSEVQIFSQLKEEELTPNNALAVARNLGVDGNVYKGSSEGPMLSYVVSDGRQWIYFNGSPYRFGYSNNQPVAHEPQVSELTPEEQIAIAENFLKQAGLLDFPYKAEYSGFFPFEVVFTQILDGNSVIFNDQMESKISVRVNPQGQVIQANYDRFLFEPVGNYPIKSAEEAWQKLTTEETPTGVETYEQSGSTQLNIEWWSRIYQVGDNPNLFGYLSVFEPVDSQGTPKLLSMASYSFVVPNDDLALANMPGTFFQVWGEVLDATTMQIAGWQISPFKDETLIGKVERENGRAFLLAGGERFLLPDLADDVPTGVELRVRGVRLSQPEPLFDWSYIETGGGGDGSGGGGGGGGGTLFAEVNLNGPQVTEFMPTATPAPVYEPGTVLEGIEGNVYIWIDRYPDGTEERKIIMSLTDETNLPGIYELHLQGSALEGIEDYQSLPVRLWGNVVSQGSDFLVVDVSSYGPIYSDLAIQAWLGTWDAVEVEGKNVLRFTAQDGKQYILDSSLLYAQTEFVGFPGDLVLLEGVQIPGKSYAGYPLIDELSGQVAVGMTSLEGYEITSDDIPINEYQSHSFGPLTIEKIELVYRANDMKFGSPDQNGPALYIQPVWRFYGHYEDGREQVILVQALKDEYLK